MRKREEMQNAGSIERHYVRRTKTLMTTFTLAVCLTSLTCKDNGVSPPAPPTKPDTTSDNFTWTSYTLGDGNGSILYDVSLVNDTLGYAVGEIYLKDSTGQMDPLPYNFERWSGRAWAPTKVTVQTNHGPVTAPFYGVLAFGAGNISTVSGLPVLGDGIQWTQYNLYDMGILGSSDGYLMRVWGTDTSNSYFVSSMGAIVRKSGPGWAKIESYTTTTINDVWGIHDAMSDADTVYCAVTDPFQSTGQKILRITNGSTVDTIGWSPGRDLFTVWTCPGAPLYVGGGGLWKNINGTWQQIQLGSNSAVLCIRGNAPNDIFVVGTFGLLAHFNGTTWKVYTGVTGATLSRISVKGNTIAAVGTNNGTPVILLGKRE
jgi:hypothetical protein